jgi:hypothetical protein
MPASTVPEAATKTLPEAPAASAPAYVPAASSEEVFSSDPGMTPGGAPLIFRPKRAQPAPAVAASGGNSEGDVKPADGAVAPIAPIGIPGARSDGRLVDPAVRESLAAAIDVFLAVDDGREPFRKIWVARRLAEKGVLLDRAEKLAAEALAGAELATEPEKSVRDMPDIDRASRLAVLTARAEDTLGWVLLKRGALAEALEYLARASNGVIKDPDYRQRVWHYAIAKQESGDERGALDLYIRGFDPASPSAPLRRRQIEDLYRKLNSGSLDGLDQRLAQP